MTFSQASARVLRSFWRSRQTVRLSLSWGSANAGTAIDSSAAAARQRMRNIGKKAPALRRFVDQGPPRFTDGGYRHPRPPSPELGLNALIVSHIIHGLVSKDHNTCTVTKHHGVR